MRCGALLDSSAYCPECGCDVSVQKQAIVLSGMYYNQGLEKAQIRDLSGAIDQLKRSLKFNKMNTDARNLLGLIYFETGEVVAALSEWVISKNMQPDHNLASDYIDNLQKDANRLDIINQTIKKYNLALENSQNGNEDAAEIQLKKILVQNPKLIKGYHLLSLLYMKKGQYEKARKILKKCARIDKTNTTTLRFLKEVDEQTGTVTSLEPRFALWGSREKKEPESPAPKVGGIRTEEQTIIPAADITDHTAVHTILNIVIGAAIGILFVWFLMVPAYVKSLNNELNQALLTYSSQLSTKDEEISRLESQAAASTEDAENGRTETENASKLAENRLHLINAQSLLSQNRADQAANEAAQIDESLLTDDETGIYEKLCTDIGDPLFSLLKEDGLTAFDGADYEAAVTKLSRASAIRPGDAEVLLCLGRSYLLLNDQNQADSVLLELVRLYPDSDQAQEALGYMSDSAKTSAETIIKNAAESSAAEPVEIQVNDEAEQQTEVPQTEPQQTDLQMTEPQPEADQAEDDETAALQ